MTQLVGTYGPRSTESMLRLLGGHTAALCDLVEIRLDYLPDAAPRMREILKASPKPVIATCRRAGEGGAFDASEKSRLDLLAKAADVGAAWVDVEDDVPAADVKRLAGRGAKILRSLHVPALPQQADDVVARLCEGPADAAKLVPLRASAADVVRLLDLVGRNPGRLAAHVANLPFSRYAGAAMGSLFTYASLLPGGLIPTPIPTVWTTLERMHFARLRRGAPLFVLVGADVEKSVSSDMLNRAFESLDLPHVALRWSCDDPAPALDATLRFGWAGIAVTIPHKERVFELLRQRGARLSADAEETGAVNTVLADENGLVGHNTDVRGLVDALRPFESVQPIAGRTTLVLGAGGAARAGVRAAIRLGSTAIVVHARRPEEARKLTLLRRADEPEVRVAATAQEAAAASPSLVLQATPAGARGTSPVFDFALLPQRALVQEMIVSPAYTANQEAALAAGHRVGQGFHMLLHQAREQVRLMTGKTPSYYAMRAAGTIGLRDLAQPIILVGLRCTGKTETGSRLARLLSRPFIDTDREVEARTGRSPDAMIRDGDEAAFREIEEKVLKDAFTRPGAVVATGGGAALHAEILASVAQLWPVVLLDASDDALITRWTAAPRAPLSGLRPKEELARQRAERMPVYRRCAMVELDTTKITPDEVAELIASFDDARWVSEPR